MKVIVADPVQPVTTITIDSLDHATILLLTLPRWSVPDDIDHFLNRVPEDAKAASEMVIVRGHRAESAALLGLHTAGGDPYFHIRANINHRVEGRPVSLLYWSAGYKLHPLTAAAEDSPLRWRT